MDVATFNLLLVEDSPGDVRLITEMLSEMGFDRQRLAVATRLSQARDHLSRQPVDLVLLDLSLPDSQRLNTFVTLHEIFPDTPIVVLSGLDDEVLALQAVQAGAQDYLIKGRIDGYLLLRAIRYAIERGRLERERLQLLLREQHARLESEAAQRRLAFLAQLSTLLASSLDYDSTLRNAVLCPLPSLADYCVLEVRNGDGPSTQVTSAVQPDQEQRLAWILGALAGEPGFAADIAAVLQDAHPKQCSIPARSTLAEGSLPADAAAAPSAPIACLLLPLTTPAQPLGVMTLIRAEPARPYDGEDLALAEEVARRVALAIDNARLYREAREAIVVRDSFLSTAAHDLTAPLTAAKAHLQLLARRAAKANFPEPWLGDGLSQIDRHIVRMSKMLSEVLDLVRMENDQQFELSLLQIDLVTLARRAREEYQRTTSRHQIILDSATPSLVGLWDGARLERVLDNLLSNAIKYSPHGGAVYLRLRKDASWAVLELEDHGLGIPAADLPHIFERFRRGRNVTGHVSGLGLGLYGVQRIIKEHGGQIEIESSEGQGTTVRVRLPLVASAVSVPS